MRVEMTRKQFLKAASVLAAGMATTGVVGTTLLATLAEADEERGPYRCRPAATVGASRQAGFHRSAKPRAIFAATCSPLGVLAVLVGPVIGFLNFSGSALEEDQIIVCDKGFADASCKQEWPSLGPLCSAPDRKDEPARYTLSGPNSGGPRCAGLAMTRCPPRRASTGLSRAASSSSAPIGRRFWANCCLLHSGRHNILFRVRDTPDQEVEKVQVTSRLPASRIA